MTVEELNAVRQLRKVIRNREQALEIVRRVEALKVPVRDGLPKSNAVDSRVERLAVSIADASRHIDKMKEQLVEAEIHLEQQINVEVTDITARALLILRYVHCKCFQEISKILGYSESHIYRLHSRILQDLKIG